MEPGPLVWALLAEVLYVRALRTLRGRGVEVRRGQVVCWHAGLLLWVAGFAGPGAWLADELLSAHMVEHLLVADLAAPLLLLGARMPVLVFLPPRVVLVWVARRRRLRAFWAALRRPLPALATYAVVLYAWHLPPLFEAALANPFVHAAQHVSFIGIGVLVWWSAIEPQKRRTPGALWKAGHLLAARFAGMFLGMAFVITRVPIYTTGYAEGERALGLSAVDDQRLAGAIMLFVDAALMVGCLAAFFLLAAREEDRRDAAEAAADGTAGRAPEGAPSPT